MQSHIEILSKLDEEKNQSLSGNTNLIQQI